jgi:hypothetical protein
VELEMSETLVVLQMKFEISYNLLFALEQFFLFFFSCHLVMRKEKINK